LSQDDQCSYVRALAACERLLAPFEYQRLIEAIQAAKTRLKKRTAWRIEGTLREFAPFAPVNVWFEYPVHTGDRAGVLGDVKPEAEYQRQKRERGAANNQARAKDRSQERVAKIENAIQLLGGIGTVTTTALYQYFKGTAGKATVKNWMREAGYRGGTKAPYLVEEAENDGDEKD
jgi:hypothetical protein